MAWFGSLVGGVSLLCRTIYLTASQTKNTWSRLIILHLGKINSKSCLTFRQDKFEIIHIIVGKYRHMYFPTANRLVNGKNKMEETCLKFVSTTTTDDQ